MQSRGHANRWRALLSLIGALVIGPSVGGVVALAGFVSTGILTNVPAGPNGVPALPTMLLLYYALGFAPARASGLTFAAVVWRHGSISYRTTALIALIGGTAATLLLVGPIRHTPRPHEIAGALISLAAALMAALTTRALLGGFGVLRAPKP